MMIEIVPFQQEHEHLWDTYVKNNNNTTFYHQIGWKKVIEKTYGHKSYYIFARDETGRITGILPLFLIKNLLLKKKMVSIPFSPYGGICADNKEIETSLIKYAVDIIKQIPGTYCEIRSFSDVNYGDKFNSASMYSTFILDLKPGPDAIWENLNRKERNMVRKAEKNNLSFEISSKRDAIADFYDIYAKNMKFLGTPVHSLNFFYRIYDFFPSHVKIAIVKHGNKIIASLFSLCFKDSLISGWGASLRGDLHYGPNDFLYWHSIKYGSEHGYTNFDFGRSLTGFNNFKFKNRWGAENRVLKYWYYPDTMHIIPPQYEFSSYAKIWSYLPESLSRMIGPQIRKYIV